MKKSTTIITLLLLCAASLFAQAPEKFSYQAVVRNASNSLVVNASVGVRVSVLQGSASGNAVYSESHMATTNANGLVTVNIGDGSVLHGTFADIDWSDGPYFLKTDIDPNGGNDYSIMSTQQLMSVPYALYAKEAGNIPTVPANVSAFTNDAGYITEQDIPEIPTVPTNVSAFTNDMGYITLGQVPAQVNADWNATSGAAQILNKPTLFSGNYNDLTNKPILFSGNYNDLTNKPNLSAVAISGSYNDLINKPVIPTAVGELTNNVGYITLSQVPAQVNSDWNATTGAAQILNKPALFSGDYNDLTNKPVIPTVPTNVSAFTNDVGYLTSFTEQQVLSISHDTLFLTGGSFVKLPAGFDGDYNSLTNKPVIPTVPTNVSTFTNDAGYITTYTEIDPQFNAWNKDYNDLINTPNIPTVPTNVSAFANDAGYLTEVTPQTLSLSGDQLTISNGNTVTIPINSGAPGRGITNIDGPISEGLNDTYIIHYTDSTTSTFVVKNGAAGADGLDGANGTNGLDGVGIAGISLINTNELVKTYRISFTDGNTYDYNVSDGATGSEGPVGPEGPAGNGITSIAKTGTNGNNDIYTIYYTDATTSQFTVTNGVNGQDGVSPVVTAEGQGSNVIITVTDGSGTHQYTIPTTSGELTQLPADWNATSGVQMILNKPTLATVAETGNYNDLNNKPNLATVAITGNYTDLTNKPTIPAAANNATLTIQQNGSSIGTFTADASVNKTINITVPTTTGELNNNSGFITASAIPSNVSAFTNDMGYLTSYTETDPQFNAWDKNYNDLTNKPTIPAAANNATLTIQQNGSSIGTFTADASANKTINITVPTTTSELNNNSGFITALAIPSNVSAFSNDVGYLTSYTETDPQFNAWDKNYNDLTNKPTLFDGNYNSLTNKPNLATVATTGNYTDLTNKPTIPAAANNATLTIQRNGSDVGTFTADASANKTINISVPTSTSELTNNSGFLTETDMTAIIAVLNNRIDSLNNVIAEMGGNVPVIPTIGQIMLTTNEVTDITVTTATAGGDITNSGGYAVTDRGVCWSLYPNPTLSDNYLAASTGGTGAYTVTLTGLSIGNTYYVRAYATNTFGTTYGNQVVFSTPTIPTVTTANLTALSGSSAAGGGEVTNSGGATVTARGVCWSTSQNPTINDIHTSDGTGVGSFTSTLTGLTPNVTYYVRAYATNMAGTAYGVQKTVAVAASELPVVETTSVTDVVISTATFNGKVTSDGGYAISAKGFCWGTSPNPTISNSKTNNGIDLGSYTANIAGLTSGTTYYVRAYATNWAGTAYGVQLTFTTDSQGQACPGTPTVTDVDGNTYHTIKIGDQCWMKENLRTTKFADGTSIAIGNDTSSVTAYRYYPNNSSSNLSTYGYLYNWKAVMNGQGSSTANPSGKQGICPTGWHVPSHAEWQQFESFVNKQFSSNTSALNSYAKVLAATSDWGTDASLSSSAPGRDQSTNNASGFTAYPVGRFHVSYSDFGSKAYFWSASSTGSTYYYEFMIQNTSSVAYNQGGVSQNALSVRCVKDDNSYTPEQRVDAQPCPYMHTMKDCDGNVYNTVQIGTQCWMKENLRTTHFWNGPEIALGSSASTSVAYRYNPNNDSNRVAAYGYLYNWKAVMNDASTSNTIPSGRQGVCPRGWHVPSDAEWTMLTNYVGGVSAYKCNSNSSYIAKALASTIGWSSSTGACYVGNDQSTNNGSGFNAAPAGLYNNGYGAFGSVAWFWSGTENSSGYAWHRNLSYDGSGVGRGYYSSANGNKARAYSVRCLRD